MIFLCNKNSYGITKTANSEGALQRAQNLYTPQLYDISYTQISPRKASSKFRDQPRALVSADTGESTQDKPDRVWKTAAADSQYLTGGVNEFLMGDHYRKSWATPITVPVIDFSGKGGLTLTGKSSGIQTETLFARDSSGNRFAIRSLNKELEQFIPKMLRRDFIIALVQDQVSASYPYAKLITQSLADSAGIYATDAEIVYIEAPQKSDITLKTSAGNLAIKEEFVSGELVTSKYDHNAKEGSYSTTEVMEELFQRTDKKIDKDFFLKIRLFDMLINDWHRHEEQYLWIEIERENDENLLRPFPIDRDNAFLLTDGVIPYLGTRTWGARKFQNFGPDIDDIIGINYVSRHLDRRFLGDMTKESWQEIAGELKNSLTDSVIEQSVRKLPHELYKLRGPFFESILKQRRDNLVEFANRYYDVLYKTNTIVGTNHPDHFTIGYTPSGDISITSETTPPGVSQSDYDTVIVRPEYTDDIYLYGMDGDDIFEFNIASKMQVNMHIVGGNFKSDIFKNDDIVRANGSVKVYPINTPNKSEISYEKRTKEFTRRNINLHGYNYQEFEYNSTRPVIDFNINDDDGLFLGTGATFTIHKFRKYPFGSQHTISGNAAFRTGSFNLNYDGIFTRAVGPADLLINTEVAVPNSRTNFFGFGNETPEFNDSDFHTVRIDQVFLSTLLRYKLIPSIIFEAGPSFEVFNPKDNQDRFVRSQFADLNEDEFDLQPFVGLVGNFRFDFTRGGIVRKEGLSALLGAKTTHAFKGQDPFLNIKGMLRFYKPINKLNTTFATRIGMARNIGNFQFFQANTIGGQVNTDINAALLNSGNFRGLPRHRFSGRTAFYQNTDLRIAIKKVDSFFLPGELGILGFADHGRVWNSDLSSKKWHVGSGGGIWYNALNKFIVKASWATSDIDQTITIGLGFLF